MTSHTGLKSSAPLWAPYFRKTQAVWSVSKGRVASLEVAQEKRLLEDKRKELGMLSIERRGLGGTLSSPEEGSRFMRTGPTEDCGF